MTQRVLVIGDIIADVYENCAFRKMCPDAPDVKALVRRTSETRPGGAANVATNLCALSPDVRVTLIGELDESMARFIKRMTGNRVEMSYSAFTDEMDLTKRRIILDGKLQLRLDNEDRIGLYTAEMIHAHLKAYLAENDPDLILVSDYGHGTIDDTIVSMLTATHRDRLIIDTKRTDLSVFDGALMCKLNQLEWDRVRKTEAAPERFFRYFVVTLGANGALLQMRRETAPGQSRTDAMHVRPHEVPVVDVCGCGDTFLAGLASSILQNGDPYTALCFANAAAATVVSEARTVTADRKKTYRLLGMEPENETR